MNKITVTVYYLDGKIEQHIVNEIVTEENYLYLIYADESKDINMLIPYGNVRNFIVTSPK